MFTVKDLLQARVHLGHKEGTLHDNMRPYLFGSRLGHLIFDLDITADRLRQALNFTGHIAYRSGIILFVSRHRQTCYMVDKTALECGEYSHTRPWDMKMFTDSKRVFGTLTRLPDLVVLLHTQDVMGQEHEAVVSAAKMCIPTVGVVDSNCNPNLITYPIPGNDDTPDSISLYLRLFSQVINKAKKMRDNKHSQ
ncbi:MRPS2 [Cordylochernes scorpioides]|uniref:MRPS2 n=1 Tax=Cordylochernes scorpioides TaxID=51811 RepID=A0ABY6L0F7_9ARAC|nr:MRPS2 [Cordylochernes scorpioides]